MGLFESNPLVLVVLVIVTVEAWSLVKRLAASLAARE
jgi:hypothetical protein